MANPTADEIREWQGHPVTRLKLNQLKDIIVEVKDKIGSGGTLATDPGLTAQLTAREVGEVAGVQVAIDVIQEEEEESDSQSIRTSRSSRS